jgi:hypothetical protein
VNARFRAHEIHHLHIFAFSEFDKRLAANAITRAFDVQPKDVRHVLEKGDVILRGRGDHPALEEDIQ